MQIDDKIRNRKLLPEVRVCLDMRRLDTGIQKASQIARLPATFTR